jgi:phosphopentomutase
MRATIIVLDSLGVGALPDAAAYGDSGVDTLGHILDNYSLDIPNLKSLGLGNIERPESPAGLVAGGRLAVTAPEGVYGRLAERSAGKDTITGHWEIAGIETKVPFKTYHNGFPQELMDEFERRIGRGYLGNCVASGTEIIEELGDEHEATGKVIVYTSADSVFQIAAHEETVPLEELYAICQRAREILVGTHAVGRVIARPFTGESGNYKRTANRRDFSLEPPRKTMLDAINESGKAVISVGKISDIFAGRSITESYPTHSNREGMERALSLLDSDFSGLCFINLVDFDMLFGHRQDISGYRTALEDFDGFLPTFISNMREDDLLIITADHGCDPGDESTDHTREYTPLIIFGDKIKPINLGTLDSFATIANTVSRLLGVDYTAEAGISLKESILKRA